MKKIIIQGKNQQAISIIHESFVSARTGLKHVELNRLLTIKKTVDGAVLELRNKQLNHLIRSEDLINTIRKDFPKDLVFEEDYIIYED